MQLIYVISWVHLDDVSAGTPQHQQQQQKRDRESLRAAYAAGQQRLQHIVDLLSSPPVPLSPGAVDLSLAQLPASPGRSNMTEEGFLGAVAAAKEYILVGVVFWWGRSGCDLVL